MMKQDDDEDNLLESNFISVNDDKLDLKLRRK